MRGAEPFLIATAPSMQAVLADAKRVAAGNMKVLITGSRGFIGGSLGRFAARAGHDVLGVARASQPSPGWAETSTAT